MSQFQVWQLGYWKLMSQIQVNSQVHLCPALLGLCTFTGHCFCIGGTTELLICGVPPASWCCKIGWLLVFGQFPPLLAFNRWGGPHPHWRHRYCVMFWMLARSLARFPCSGQFPLPGTSQIGGCCKQPHPSGPPFLGTVYPSSASHTLSQNIGYRFLIHLLTPVIIYPVNCPCIYFSFSSLWGASNKMWTKLWALIIIYSIRTNLTM